MPMITQMIALTWAARTAATREPPSGGAVLVGDDQPHLVDAEPRGGPSSSSRDRAPGPRLQDAGVVDLERDPSVGAPRAAPSPAGRAR